MSFPGYNARSRRITDGSTYAPARTTRGRIWKAGKQEKSDFRLRFSTEVSCLPAFQIQFSTPARKERGMYLQASRRRIGIGRPAFRSHPQTRPDMKTALTRRSF